MSKTIGQLPAGGVPNTAALIEAELSGVSISYILSDVIALIGDVSAEDVSVDGGLFEILVGNDVQEVFDNLDSYLNALGVPGLGDVLASDNIAGGESIADLLSINNSSFDFELIVSNGSVDFYFGNSPGGIFGLDASADQIFFTANQWAAQSSDGNMYGLIDIDTQLIEFGNQSNYLRITDFDIEVGSPILGYSTTVDSQAYVNNLFSSSAFKKDRVKGRTTAALPTCNANAGFTTLTSVANQAFSGLTTETDGLTYGILQDILVMNETDKKRWGIYQLTQPGSAGTPWVLTRRSDSNPGTDMTSAVYSVEQGTRFKNTSWKQVTLNPVLGTDNVIFVPFGDNIIEDSVSGYYKIISTSGVLSTTSV